MSEMKIRNVGFIGLGLMGKPMARNLMKAGCHLTVKSRGRPPIEEIVAAGATEAPSPRAVAEASEVVITMLPNSPDVREVCLGKNGIIEAADSAKGRPAPLTVVDMSTISPSVSIEIANQFKTAGIDYLEAPVSGGDVGAIKGTLSIMAGGPRPVFDRVKPLFDVMGKSAVLVGDWGAGQTTKLANNIICAATIEAVGEALVLVAKAGVDPEKMYEAIKGGAAACWSLDQKVPKIVVRDFKPGFMVKLHLKDLKLALDAGKELGVPLPVTAIVKEMLEELNNEGKGDDDNGSLVRCIEKRARCEVHRKK
jgi:2-hydroxy-3-oxopropionate reductase